MLEYNSNMPTPQEYAMAAADSAFVGQFQTAPTQANFDRLANSINTAETRELSTSLTTANASANSMLIYGGLLSRNAVIDSVARDLTNENQKIAKGGAETYSRQTEINEWQAQNKMDTLFFLQVLFLYFAAVVILLYFRQMGILPNAVFYMIVGLGLVIILGILWNRASYSKMSRDNRYWNRRYIGLGDSGGLAAKLQCSLSAS